MDFINLNSSHILGDSKFSILFKWRAGNGVVKAWWAPRETNEKINRVKHESHNSAGISEPSPNGLDILVCF